MKKFLISISLLLSGCASRSRVERAHDNFIYGCLEATDETGISVLPGFTEDLDGETAETFQGDFCEGLWRPYLEYNEPRGVL